MLGDLKLLHKTKYILYIQYNTIFIQSPFENYNSLFDGIQLSGGYAFK